jgi:hypothetical protein
LSVESHDFVNELRFTDVADFARYYRATPLLAKTAKDDGDREALVDAACERVRRQIEEQGAFVIRKVAVALLGRKAARQATA